MSISKPTPPKIAATAQLAPYRDRCVMLAEGPLRTGQPTVLRRVIVRLWDPIRGRSVTLLIATTVLGHLRSTEIPIAPRLY